MPEENQVSFLVFVATHQSVLEPPIFWKNMRYLNSCNRKLRARKFSKVFFIPCNVG